MLKDSDKISWNYKQVKHVVTPHKQPSRLKEGTRFNQGADVYSSIQNLIM